MRSLIYGAAQWAAAASSLFIVGEVGVYVVHYFNGRRWRRQRVQFIPINVQTSRRRRHHDQIRAVDLAGWTVVAGGGSAPHSQCPSLTVADHSDYVKLRGFAHAAGKCDGVGECSLSAARVD